MDHSIFLSLVSVGHLCNLPASFAASDNLVTFLPHENRRHKIAINVNVMS